MLGFQLVILCFSPLEWSTRTILILVRFKVLKLPEKDSLDFKAFAVVSALTERVKLLEWVHLYLPTILRFINPRFKIASYAVLLLDFVSSVVSYGLQRFERKDISNHDLTMADDQQTKDYGCSRNGLFLNDQNYPRVWWYNTQSTTRDEAFLVIVRLFYARLDIKDFL